MMADELYDKKINCLYCGLNFLSKKMRRSHIRIKSRDTDFCSNFVGENPLFYDVFVCPSCGFAFTEGFSDISSTKRKKLEEEYIRKISVPQLCGKRTIEDAMKCYKLAFLCAQIIGEKKYIFGNISLRIAWLNRYIENKKEELRFLEMALSYYENVYETERMDRIPMEEGMLLYLVGEINARLGNYEKTRRWFSYIFTDQNLDRKWRKIARERWVDYRQMVHEIQEDPEGYDLSS